MQLELFIIQVVISFGKDCHLYRVLYGLKKEWEDV